MPVNATDPATALDEATADFAAWGLTLDGLKTMQLTHQVWIQVTPLSTPASSSPCDSIVQGGYLGADNQLIRLQIANVGNTPQLLWGYDNASFIYRAQLPPSQGGVQNPQVNTTTLQLLQSPVDAYHAPQAGQFVEVLRTAAILGKEPDVTAPAGQNTIVRCVAERTGFVTTVATAYDNSDNSVVLKGTLPAGYPPQAGDPPGNPLFLRVWQGLQQIFWQSQQLANSNQLSQPISLIDPVTTLPLGIQVTISVPQGGALPVGAFWMIAVRPGTPQLVYPEEFLTGPQWPDGPRSWICPLALIHWLGQGDFSAPGFSAPVDLKDCRKTFANLVDLTNQTWGDQLNVTSVHTLASSPVQIYNGGLNNKGPVLTSSDVGQGLQISLNQNIDPASATQAACFVTLDLPYDPDASTDYFVYARIVLEAKVSTLDASTILWSPTSQFTKLTKTLQWQQPDRTFRQDWWGETSVNWRYSTQRVLQFYATQSTSTVSSQVYSTVKVNPGATSLSAVLPYSPAQSGQSAVGTGIVFNWNSEHDYWLFGFNPVAPGPGQTLGMILQHVGTTQSQTFSVPLPMSVPNVTLEIDQAPGSSSLSFSVTFPGSANPTSIPFFSPPKSLEQGTNVGLSALLPGSSATTLLSLDFPRMTLGYGSGSPVVLLPADFKFQLTLTVKRSFLQPPVSDGNPARLSTTFSAPRPDFSVWFWWSPADSAPVLAHASVPFSPSSRP